MRAVAASADPLLRKQDSRSLAFERVYARYEKGPVSVVPWFGIDRSRRTDRFGEVPATLAQDPHVARLLAPRHRAKHGAAAR